MTAGKRGTGGDSGGTVGARGQAQHAAPGPTPQEKVVRGQGGGLSKFRGTFPLEILQPCSAPYRKRQPGRAGAPHDPRLPAAARPRRPGALAVAFFFFSPSLSPGCFSDTSFFRIGKKKKKKVSASRRLQWSVLGLQRQSSPTFPLPPQLRARLKLRLCWGPNLPAAHLHSNVRAKAPGSGLQPGGPTLPRLRPARSCASPSPGPVWKGAAGAPGEPRERAERSRALGQGGRELPRPERCELAFRTSQGGTREGRTGRGPGGTPEPGTTARKRPGAELQSDPGMEGAGEEE